MRLQRTASHLHQINEQYGGKRAWLSAHAYHLMDKLCFLPSSLTKAQLSTSKRLVFVCQGNICRSPYGEARARQLGISSTSFGLSADNGKKANPSATEVARQRGVVLENHSATHFSKFSFEADDLVLTFEPRQLVELVTSDRLPDQVAVDLLGRWCSPSFPYLHDPYGLSEAYFHNCFNRIDQALMRLLPFVPSSATFCIE